jgi:isoamylase
MDKATSGRTLAQAAQLLRRSVVREGKPFPLGATWDGLGVNFALFSAHATKVELGVSCELSQAVSIINVI